VGHHELKLVESPVDPGDHCDSESTICSEGEVPKHTNDYEKLHRL